MGLGGVQCVAQESAVPNAQNFVPMSSSETCRTVRKVLPAANILILLYSSKSWKSGSIESTQLTPDGFIVDASPISVSAKYSTFRGASVGVVEPLQVDVGTSDGYNFELRFPPGYDQRAVLHVTEALNQLKVDAEAGRGTDCSVPPPDPAAELAAFTQQSAAWRALNPKPPLSDEVEKKRLLAEDDVSNKDLAAAIEDYEAGIKLDPTWAQGWFNSALLYAEQQDYEHAAFNMKHYLILLPDAPDAAAAREKLLLWEARAEKAAGK